MKPSELITKAEAGEIIGDGSDQIAALLRRIEHTQQWYATRWERLRDLLKDSDLESDACCIMANGVRSAADPPIYAQMMQRLRHKIEEYERKNRYFRKYLEQHEASYRDAEEKADVDFYEGYNGGAAQCCHYLAMKLDELGLSQRTPG